MTNLELAMLMDTTAYAIDTYEYLDNLEGTVEDQINNIVTDLNQNNTEAYVKYFTEAIDEMDELDLDLLANINMILENLA